MLNTFPDEALSASGYTQAQIETIRNFNGSEAEMYAISSTVTITTVTVNFNYDGDYSRGQLSYHWEWSGIPAFMLRDIIAVSWNDWAVEYETSAVNYYHMNSGNAYTTLSATYSTDGNGIEGASHKFSVLIDDYYYAKNGSGRFDIRSDVHAKKDFFYYIEYGHSQVVVTWPTFSISTGGADLSISFSGGVATAGSKSGAYYFS